jgi:hypothetical protein
LRHGLHFSCNFISSTHADWLTAMLYTCVKEVLGSNLEWDTSYPDWGVAWFSSASPGNYWGCALISPWRFRPKPFQFIIHHSYCLILYSLRQYWYLKLTITYCKFISDVLYDVDLWFPMHKACLVCRILWQKLLFADGISLFTAFPH